MGPQVGFLFGSKVPSQTAQNIVEEWGQGQQSKEEKVANKVTELNKFCTRESRVFLKVTGMRVIQDSLEFLSRIVVWYGNNFGMIFPQGGGDWHMVSSVSLNVKELLRTHML